MCPRFILNVGFLSEDAVFQSFAVRLKWIINGSDTMHIIYKMINLGILNEKPLG